ncbi:MAG TPA: isochorismatase family cysteine hydrolase [Syntrophales bacterium]|jgi:nicotinamidase-related amidase|nr:isochorismatase family cysteine hydrolase [Syntrophales bacterium]HRT62320.1 isochorismatase family cysteine hydrolase [Syntrophales bacterium]
MKLDASKTALLVVDMQKYQAGEGGNLPRFFREIYGPAAEAGAVKKGREIVRVIGGLLSAFRETGASVVYLAFGSLADDGSDLVPYVRLWNEVSRKKTGLPAIVSVSDPGYAVMKEIEPQRGEPIVNKTAQGAFGASSIDHVLKQMGVQTLVVAGMYTNHCVIATCIGAADAGYRVIVPADAVGTWDERLHEQALEVMRSWVIPSSSREVIAALRKKNS